MKRLTVTVLAGVVLLAAQTFAGNGDLIVDGNIGIGTATPTGQLSIGDNIISKSTIYSAVQGVKVKINDAPTQTSGIQASLHLINQPNVSENSSAIYSGTVTELSTPATSGTNYAGMQGGDYISDHNGSGLVKVQIGLYGRSRNHSAGTVKTQIGVQGFSNNTAAATGSVETQYGGYFNALNNSASSVTTQYGSLFSAFNNSAGSVTTQYGTSTHVRNWGGTVGTAYGAYVDAYNNSTGTITTAYGLAIGDPTRPAIYNPTGTVTTGYGIYLGSLQATTKWSLYSADATAPSYFAGKVGIGTAIPAYALDVTGLVASNGVVLTSDAKYKKDLLAIDAPLDKIINLGGVSYTWKTDEFKEKNFPAGRHYGVIAQEVEKVLPEVVNTAADGSKTVAYTEIIPVLIEAIKEQQKQIDELKKLVKQAQ